MKLTKKLYLLILLTTLAILSACNDAPTDVGASFLGDTIAVYTLNTHDTTIITQVNSRIKRTQLYNSGSLMIGRTKQSSTTDLHTAVTFLRFKDIPNNFDSINNKTITGCKLLMYATHPAFGDTNSALSFTVNSIYNDHPWADTTAVFNWDKIFTDDYGTTSFINPSPLGSFTGVIPYVVDDTSTYEIDIPLDTSFIVPWIQIIRNRDSLKVADSTNWGIALMPSASNNVIRYFSTLSVTNQTAKQPIIRIYFNSPSGAPDSLDMLSTFDASWVSAPAPDPKSITVEGGPQIFTDLSFDLGKILPDVAGINLAELELTLDRSKSQIGNIPLNKSLYATLRSDIATDTLLGWAYTSDTVNPATPDIYKFASIRSALEKWNAQSGSAKNKGTITLQSLTSGYINKYVFYGADAADTTKRPKLRIIYTKRSATSNGKK